MKVSKKVNYEELARSTDEFNGAQLKVRLLPSLRPLFATPLVLTSDSFARAQAVCVEAGMIALREGFTEINHEHYLSGILCVPSLLARPSSTGTDPRPAPQRGPVQEEERPRASPLSAPLTPPPPRR